jgi:hypothetical protein
MKTMRMLVWMCAIIAAGCTNECKQGTALLSFMLEGGAAAASTLQVEVDVGGQSRISTIAVPSGRDEGSLEIDFASGYPAAGRTLAVAIVALEDGQVIGRGDVAAPILRGCTTLSVQVDAIDSVGDLGGETADMASVDLATAACAPATNTQSTQCPAAQPICGADGVCRACAQHSECTLGVCKPDGQCALAAEIAFVDNAGGNCTGAGHAGTQADPYCQIQDAIDATGALPYAHVAGSGVTYHSLLVSGQSVPIDVTIVGTGVFSGAGASSIHDFNKNAITVDTTTPSPVHVSIDGLVLQGGTESALAGIQCEQASGAATVTVAHSVIEDSGGVAVDNSGCSVTVDRTSFVNNHGGGLKSSAGSNVVTNSFLVRNGTLAVDIGLGGQLVFAFNTVTNNQGGTNGIGGISCPSSGASTTIQSSIVWNNVQNAGSQFVGKCVLQNVVTGTDTFPGAIQLTPTFATNANDYLAPNDAANKACCVDKVGAPTTPNADHDVDFSHRPKGTAWDIGAHEVQ